MLWICNSTLVPLRFIYIYLRGIRNKECALPVLFSNAYLIKSLEQNSNISGQGLSCLNSP